MATVSIFCISREYTIISIKFCYSGVHKYDTDSCTCGSSIGTLNVEEILTSLQASAASNSLNATDTIPSGCL